MSKDGFKQDWFKNWFGKDYVEVYAHRDERDARNLIKLIRRQIPISTKTRILDAGCGNGRHACALKEFTPFVVGLDLSATLLNLAREQCALTLVRGDLRWLPFKPSFDVLVNLFTSFGYFESDDENFQVVREFFKVLKPGGMLFMDYLNAHFVKANLKKMTVRKSGDREIQEERKIVGERVEKTITIRQGSTVRRYLESVKLYDREALLTMLQKAGFKTLKVFGDYQGREFFEHSPRLMVLAQKVEKGAF